jgi:hypothetical protein
MGSIICAASNELLTPGAIPVAAGAPSSEGQQVFQREGEFWTVIYEGAVCHFRDTRGFEFLAQLLRRPGERVTAVELIAAGASERSAARCDDPDAASHPEHDSSESERARVNVTRAIKAALRRIAERDASLAAHLRATIKTGSACCYLPDPRVPIQWLCAANTPVASRLE